MGIQLLHGSHAQQEKVNLHGLTAGVLFALIETVCDEEHLNAAIAAARKAHAYEEPLINIIPLHGLDA